MARERDRALPALRTQKLGERWGLTTRDVAQHLACSVATVRRIPPEELPFVRIGASKRSERRYRASDVQDYTERHAVRNIAEQ